MQDLILFLGTAAQHGHFNPAVADAVVDAVYSTGSQCRRILPLRNAGSRSSGAFVRTRVAIISSTGGLMEVSTVTRKEYAVLSAVSAVMHATTLPGSGTLPIPSPLSTNKATSLLGSSLRVYRSQMQPTQGVVDGDCLGLFLLLPREQQNAVVSSARCGSVESVVELIESLHAQEL